MKTYGIYGFFSVVSTAVTGIIGVWETVLTWLIIMMVFDYLTGLAAAIKHKKVNSDIMYWGGIRKAVILIVIAVAHMFDVLFFSEPIVRTMAIYFYLLREITSVTENVGKLGVPLPIMLKGLLVQLKAKVGEDDGKGGNSRE